MLWTILGYDGRHPMAAGVLLPAWCLALVLNASLAQANCATTVGTVCATCQTGYYGATCTSTVRPKPLELLPLRSILACCGCWAIAVLSWGVVAFYFATADGAERNVEGDEKEAKEENKDEESVQQPPTVVSGQQSRPADDREASVARRVLGEDSSPPPDAHWQEEATEEDGGTTPRPRSRARSTASSNHDVEGGSASRNTHAVRIVDDTHDDEQRPTSSSARQSRRGSSTEPQHAATPAPSAVDETQPPPSAADGDVDEDDVATNEPIEEAAPSQNRRHSTNSVRTSSGGGRASPAPYPANNQGNVVIPREAQQWAEQCRRRAASAWGGDAEWPAGGPAPPPSLGTANGAAPPSTTTAARHGIPAGSRAPSTGAVEAPSPAFSAARRKELPGAPRDSVARSTNRSPTTTTGGDSPRLATAGYYQTGGSHGGYEPYGSNAEPSPLPWRPPPVSSHHHHHHHQQRRHNDPHHEQELPPLPSARSAGNLSTASSVHGGGASVAQHNANTSPAMAPLFAMGDVLQRTHKFPLFEVDVGGEVGLVRPDELCTVEEVEAVYDERGIKCGVQYYIAGGDGLPLDQRVMELHFRRVDDADLEQYEPKLAPF